MREGPAFRKRFQRRFDHDEGLRQRCAARISRSRQLLHEQLERDFIVRKRAHGRAPDSRQKIGKRKIFRKRATNRDCIQKTAEQIHRLFVVPATAYSTDNDILLIGFAMQQSHERSRHGHEEGRALFLADTLQRRRGCRRNLKNLHGARIRLRGRAGMIGS